MKNTPTTATAAMRELLKKHPTPWSCDESLGENGETAIRDANGTLFCWTQLFDSGLDLQIGPAIVSAVNATAENKVMDRIEADAMEMASLRERRSPLHPRRRTSAEGVGRITNAIAADAGRGGEATMNDMMRLPSECVLRRKDEMPRCPKCKQKYLGNGKSLCVDCEWIERAKTPGFALRAAGGGGER